MTHRLFELNQNEISNVSGGLVAEMAVMFVAVAAFKAYTSWRDGDCDDWKRGSATECYVRTSIEEGLFWGPFMTLLDRAFQGVKVKTS